MTREEAIKSLEMSINSYEALEIGEEELKMAIEALKTQKQGEWIEWIEWLKQKEPNSMSPSYEYIKGWNDAIDEIVEIMKGGGEK